MYKCGWMVAVAVAALCLIGSGGAQTTTGEKVIKGKVPTGCTKLLKLSPDQASKIRMIDKKLQEEVRALTEQIRLKRVAARQGMLKVLSKERGQLVKLLGSLDTLGGAATRVIEATSDTLTSALHQLDPVLTSLIKAGQDLPNALELAATRLRAMSPLELLERLRDHWQLLDLGNRNAPERHRTMSSCIEWSYAQCSPTERQRKSIPFGM